MPNEKTVLKNRPAPPASGVERACSIARDLFNTARGNYETDKQTIAVIAQRAHLPLNTVKSLLTPSLRPKDVGLEVWGRLVSAYRRLLVQQLAALETEIARVEALGPDNGALCDLLDDAKDLVSKIEAIAAPPDAPGSAQLRFPFSVRNRNHEQLPSRPATHLRPSGRPRDGQG